MCQGRDAVLIRVSSVGRSPCGTYGLGPGKDRISSGKCYSVDIHVFYIGICYDLLRQEILENIAFLGCIPNTASGLYFMVFEQHSNVVIGGSVDIRAISLDRFGQTRREFRWSAGS